MKKILLLFLLTFTALAAPLFNSFNFGELSPLIKYRVDIEQRNIGVETMENMIVRVPGAAFRRPGTEYIASTKNNGQVRLIPFEYATDDTYILEFGDEYIRFFRDGGQIVDGVGTEDLTALDNVVSHWLCNDISGVTVADDEGNHNGTATTDITNLTATGKVGNSCFDMNEQYCFEVSDHADFSFTDDSNDTAFSLICWAYITPQYEEKVLISKWRDDNATREWKFALTNESKLKLTLIDTSIMLSDNRIAQWKLNENAANKIVLDEDATSHDGLTQNNNTEDLSATGKINTCLNFDGIDCVVITNDHDELSFGNGTTDSAFSVAAWVYFDGYGSSQGILSKWADTTGAEAREWSVTVQASKPLLILYDESANRWSQRRASNAISIGWHFLVVSYDGTGGANADDGITWYVDGDEVSTYGSTDAGYIAMENTATKVIIGGYYTTAGIPLFFWRDKLDNVILFNKELSPAEISSLYNSGNGTENLAGAEIYAISDDAIDTGWRFLATTYNAPSDESAAADGITLYVDGEAIDSTATNDDNYTAMQNGAEEVRIGAQRNSGDTANEKFWADKIDGVAIFSNELSASEVASLYSTTPYEIESPYSASIRRDIHYVQINDVMYLVCSTLAPRKLSRYDHARWTLEKVDWTWGPFLDENVNDITITPSATTGTITLTANSENLFVPDQVGALWKLRIKQDPTYIEATIDDDPCFTDTIPIQGDYLFTIVGTYDALITLEKSDDDGTSWEPVYPKLSGGDAVDTEFSGSEAEAGWIYRAQMSDRTSGSAAVKLIAYDTYIDGYVKILTWVDSNTVTAEVIEELVGTTATKKWSEGAWSDYRGWPRTIGLYQNRLIAAGTEYQPNGLWFSTSIDYEKMEVTSLDSGAISYEVADCKQNPILWLQNRGGVIAGTSGSLIRIASQSSNSALTAETIGSEIQSMAGSCSIQAALLNDSIIFVDRNRKKVRDMVYDLQTDGFISPELTILSEHITDPCILEMAVQNRPDPIVWFIKGDGNCASMTYDRGQIVTGWARHITNGSFESVACIPAGDEDEVWFVANRTIDSNTVRYIERLKPHDWGEDANNCWYVDSGLSYSGSETGILTNLSHVEGEEIQIFDGNTFETQTVSGGQVTLDVNVTSCVAGLSYTSILQTFPIELPMQQGYSVGHKKKIYEIATGFYKTMYGDYCYLPMIDDPCMYPILYDDNYGSLNGDELGSDSPFTGLIRLPMDSSHEDEARVKFIQDEPYPMNITALSFKMEISD
jgi:hypothetical protein